MWHYDAPLREMRFVIEDVLQAPAAWRSMPAFADLDMDTAAEVLAQAARFASEVLQPLNGPGDREGCRLVQGHVKTPAGFAQAWASFVEGGWPALACDPDVGGQGLPQLLNAALFEMLVSANHAWTMYPGLLHGAYETLLAHAEPALRERYLPKIVSGEWLAAMALTEPQAGSDLGLVRTKAAPRPDGSLAVTGSKIFISGGDHDLSENIVHLVLCRLPDAPAGPKGLSLALVPKFLPDGSRNAMVCDGLEHKMGIHGSATCAMRYDGAIGWLVGEPNRGLAAMFVMMNAARLHVGLQGLGHLEMAAQNARRYALERLQMRAVVRPPGASAAADPIARHPAMRRSLRSLQAVAEGLRVVAYQAAMWLDEAHRHPDAGQREQAFARAAFLTPVVKAFATHWGFQGASEALQVFGGYGYVREFGIEQTLRDSRIALVYEGTNEIQAIDLLLRKTLADGGAAFERWLDELAPAATAHDAFGSALSDQLAAARAALGSLRQAQPDDPEAPWRVADDFLMGVGHLLLAWAWARIATAARRCQDDAAWAAERESLARHGVAWVLPQARVHWHRVSAAAPLDEVRA
ncbi:acyl-CoA dehydrogenase family protein [Piscinibacter sp. XHJ-5]|uniref:acyl-CoA dehydrogenase family protein n=1 Tax=Piscinibacter sp. XHJ-5 TaxID=3037797 RepID=UPI002452E7C1|nr:acyl-CoA dehydrogenase family protein [Piscinibacter sp. XHJ-5]